MAKTLFIIDDEDWHGLPDEVQKKVLAVVRDLFSFIPQFTVTTSKAEQLPETIHFTDSVVSLVQTDITVSAVLRDIQKKEDANVKFSIKDKGLHLDWTSPPASFDGNPDRSGVGGNWKVVKTDGAGTKATITMTYGVASLESAESAYLEEVLHGRTADDIRKEQRGKDANWSKTKEGIQSNHDLDEAKLLSQHKPLKEWPKDQWESIATALARIIAHEARHQYINDHSSKGLGADAPRVWGDKNYEAFDSTDQANILKKIKELDDSWNTATVHVDLCPQQKSSPFNQ